MSYSTFFSQRSMAFDDYRNGLYADAIRKVVMPETVVLDLGAGLGIHGLVAAAAGAKRVYLVEPEPVAKVAIEIARTNGLAERIVVIEGKIEEVELPEQVDLIVSVFTGNLLFSEDLLPSLYHARARYLKPGGRMLPDMAELMLAPASAPELHAKHVGCWSKPNLGLDFSPARRFAANEILWLRREEFRIDRVAPGAALASIDLTTSTSADCHGEASYRIQTSGLCHGLLGWLRMRLGDHWLSSDPSEPEVHWSPVLLPLDPPVELQAGEEIILGLNRPAGGDWTWTLSGKSGTRRHSSFLSRPDGPDRLKMFAPDYRPALGQDGELALQALTLMRESNSNRDIALALMQSHPGRFNGLNAAMHYVQGLVRRYSRRGKA